MIEKLIEKYKNKVFDLQAENTKLKKEKNELIKWLKEEAETYRFRENYEELSITGACEMILNKLKESDKNDKRNR